MTYFNTTHETGAELAHHEAKADSQADRIREYFEKVGPGVLQSPSTVWAHVFDCACPLTSVRRAMTVLTKKGILTKTDRKMTGAYGRREYCWRLRKSGEQYKLL